MASQRPRVNIGFPVYNGQAFARAAIESVLSQTFGDFQLIICDNASTDATADICREFAARDSRISYHRNPVNLGAGPNFSLAFQRSVGSEFFKWMAADDTIGPAYLEQCIRALDADPSCVLAHAKAGIIDRLGQRVRFQSDGTAQIETEQLQLRDIIDPPRQTDSPDVALRTHEILIPTKWCFEIFGLMRASVLRRIPMNLNYYGSDKPLLLAMALRGRFAQIDQELFFRRFHAGQSSNKSNVEQAVWIDARASGIRRLVPAQAKCLAAFVRHIAIADLKTDERMRCFAEVGRFCRWLAELVYSQRHERGFLHRLIYSRG